ncbi:MAG: hypothetical protein J6A25_02800 [Lachnospiraceae bacterium]|nr:hypothetical protein [Lachnospiraceae bacterium]
MEVESIIEIVEVKYICDKCWRGEMEIVVDDTDDGVFFSDYRNKHKCNVCGHKQMLVGVYPYIKDNEDDE